MLVHLSIRDLAIVDALELSFEPGMTALTGETGAGKSIVVGALSLLMGERARTDSIRAGADDAEVGAQFALSGKSAERVEALLKEMGLPACDDGALVLRRMIHRHGRHRQTINGTIATVSQLKTIAGPLIDLTGQHAGQALLRPAAQLDVLDAFGEHQKLRDAVREAHQAALDLAKEKAALLDAEDGKISRLDWLRYQLDEIAEIDPQPGEEDTLVVERNRLKNITQLRESVAQALALLSESSDAALPRVQQAAMALGQVSDDDSVLQGAQEAVEEAAILIDDAARSIAGHQGSLADDPARLADIEDRLDAIRTLCRKHRGDVDAVLAARDEMEKELHAIAHAEERLAQIDDELSEKRAELISQSKKLSKKRASAARKLSADVQAELSDLGMPQAAFVVAVEPAPAASDAPLSAHDDGGPRALTPSGWDRVELRLCANAGEETRPLAKVASGGELSRILLALKRVLLRKDPVPISIFDEVDAGVGGAVGEAIGEKLRAVAEGRQVLCVTHLPQIAAQAHVQLKVSKTTRAGRTTSRIEQLDDEGRREEVARMLGGKKLTAKTREHAQEMLNLASPKKAPNKKATKKRASKRARA